MRPTALVVGHVTLDRTRGGLRPGGSAYYAGLALAALGADVRVLTAAGPDFPAEALQLTGSPGSGALEAVIVASSATTTFENAYDGAGRRTQRVHAAAPPLTLEALPRGWRDADLLLLAPVLGELAPSAFTAGVRARPAGLCVQGLVREVRAGGAVAARRLDDTPGALAGLSLAVAGDDEVEGQPDLVAVLARSIPLVAHTRGRRGCEVVSAAGTSRVGIYATQEREPTGAGDVFAAAMLLGLARGDDPISAARLGAAAASVVVEGDGGETLGRVGEAWKRREGVPIG